MNKLSISKDYFAAVLLFVVGVGVVSRGLSYGTGTLRHMGPGFMPVAFGSVIVLVGILIALTADEGGGVKLPSSEMVRFGAGILAGIIAFIVLSKHGGFAPAAFSCVFFSAIGSRSNSICSALTLALAMAAVGSAIFTWALTLGIPMFAWS